MTFKIRLRTIILSIIGLLALYLLASVLFFNATPEDFRITDTIPHHYSVDDPAFMMESGILTGSAWSEGNRIEILNRGEDIFGAMLEEIEKAERSITKETFNYWGEEVGTPMAEALSEAAGRGVDVRFIMDYIGSVQATDEQLSVMEDAGVNVVRWREPAWYQMARFNYRTHRKLLVVDGKVGFTGGANTADDWLPAPEDGGYKDFHFRFEGPIVSEMQGAFSENWVSAKGELLTGEKWYTESDSAGAVKAQITTSHPRGGKHLVRKMMLHAISSAADRVRIGSAYFFPDEGFIKALIETRERGVDIQILVPGEKIDQNYLRYASQTLWGDLLRAGIEIYEYKPTMYHAKLLLVDDSYVSIGSTNFDNRSFRLNDETNVNLISEEFAAEMNDYFDQNLEESEQITLEMWEDRPLWQKIAGRINAALLGPYL